GGGLVGRQCCRHAGQRGRGAGGAGCVGDVPGADSGRERVRVLGSAPGGAVPGGDVCGYVSLTQWAAEPAAAGAGGGGGAAGAGGAVGLRDGPGIAVRSAVEGRLWAGAAGYRLRPVAVDVFPAQAARFTGPEPAVFEGPAGGGGHGRAEG